MSTCYWNFYVLIFRAEIVKVKSPKMVALTIWPMKTKIETTNIYIVVCGLISLPVVIRTAQLSECKYF